MMERIYTVAEIEALRQAIENKYLFGTYRGPTGNFQSQAYNETEKASVIEQRVRTHMLAGHTADDLLC